MPGIGTAGARTPARIGARRRRRGYFPLAAVVTAAVTTVGLISAAPVRAVNENPTCTATWTGAADSKWNTGGNWSPSGVPDSSDVVCIGPGLASPATVAASAIAGCISDARKL